MPPAKGESLTFDYSAPPDSILEFGPKSGGVRNYIPFSGNFTISNLSRSGDENKTLSSVRLVAESKGSKVTINFIRAGGEGQDRMWVLIESGGDISGIWRLSGKLETEIEQDAST